MCVMYLCHTRHSVVEGTSNSLLMAASRSAKVRGQSSMTPKPHPLTYCVSSTEFFFPDNAYVRMYADFELKQVDFHLAVFHV